MVDAGNLGQETGIALMDYLFDTAMGIGWFRGLANPSGLAILAALVVMAAFSHRVVRKSGHFEVRRHQCSLHPTYHVRTRPIRYWFG